MIVTDWPDCSTCAHPVGEHADGAGPCTRAVEVSMVHGELRYCPCPRYTNQENPMTSRVEPAVVVDCPTCGAKAGSFCRKVNGEPRQVHSQRQAVALRQRGEQSTEEAPVNVDPDRIYIDVACPSCGAAAGMLCVTKGGDKVYPREVHTPRLEAWHRDKTTTRQPMPITWEMTVEGHTTVYLPTDVLEASRKALRKHMSVWTDEDYGALHALFLALPEPPEASLRERIIAVLDDPNGWDNSGQVADGIIDAVRETIGGDRQAAMEDGGPTNSGGTIDWAYDRIDDLLKGE